VRKNLGIAALVAAAFVVGGAGGMTIDPPLRLSTGETDGHALMVTHNSRGTNASAITAVSTNPNDTAVGIRGRETGRGTLKVTNERADGAANVNAAVVSLRAEALGAEQTNAQGIFFDAPGQGTTGKFLNFRNRGVEQFTVASDGSVRLHGTVSLMVDAEGRLIAITPRGTTVLAP
jgi:hypothetical protein